MRSPTDLRLLRHPRGRYSQVHTNARIRSYGKALKELLGFPVKLEIRRLNA